MQARIVAAPRGARWLAEGWRLFRVAPLSWLALVFAYWLIMTLASLVPLLGVVAASVLVPPFAVGFMAAARAAESEAHELGEMTGNPGVVPPTGAHTLLTPQSGPSVFERLAQQPVEVAGALFQIPCLKQGS